MTSQDSSDFISDEDWVQINSCCNKFERTWQSGSPPTIDDCLRELPNHLRLEAALELIALDMLYRSRSGRAIGLTDYQSQFPWVPAIRLEEVICDVSRELAEPSFGVGHQIGQYRLLQQIGAGGMGTVFRAEHIPMQRTVAIKLVRPELQQNPVSRRRFQREVRAGAKLSHPNIVTAFDAGEDSGTLYLVTELVDGIDLSRLVRERGPLTLITAIECIRQAAEGLAYAHQQHVIHRDIKPGNLLFVDPGVIKILDMGLARLLTDIDDPEAGDLTVSGMVMGTAAYMAPEQARDTRNADARSDLYSLGCVFYFLLSGTRPFQRSTAIETIMAHSESPPPPISSHLDMHSAVVVEAVESMYQRMTEKLPEKRFQSMLDLLDVIDPILGQLRNSATTDLDFSTDRFGSNALNRRPNTDGAAGELSEKTALVTPVSTVRPANRDSSKTWHQILVRLGFVLVVLTIVGFVAMFASVTLDPTPIDQIDFSLAFDGVGAYAEAHPSFQPPTAQATLEAIVSVERARTSNFVTWTGPNWMSLFVTPDGHWGVARKQRSDSILIQATHPTEFGRRYHIAGTWDGTSLHLYVDGVSAETKSIEYQLGVTSPGLFIGGVPPDRLPPGENDRFFAGTIDAVRVSETVQYIADFVPSAELTDGPGVLANFAFDEGQGDTSTDRGTDQRWVAIHGAKWQKIRTPDH